MARLSDEALLRRLAAPTNAALGVEVARRRDL
jgi:hypothetical protein